MKLFTPITTLLVIIAMSSGAASAQVIWTETFNFPNGTTSGPAGKWNSACGACASGDYFEVRSNSFRAGDVNNWSTWESEVIPIVGCGDFGFSLAAQEFGDHEGAGCGCGINQDYFDVYYSVNGGPFVVIQNWNGDGEAGHTLSGDSQNGLFNDADWQFTTVSQSGLSGTSLQLRVQMRNTAGDEVLVLDDIVVTCNSPLPVEMVDLRAEMVDENAEITWTTAQETGSHHFLVERSSNGTSFFSIGRVEAAGNSDQSNSYRFTDRNPVTGRTFYRLRQVDQDGSHHLTKVVEVAGSARPLSLTDLYPNPTSGELHLNLLSRTRTDARLQVLDLMGHEVRNEAISLTEGDNALDLNLSELAGGMYLLRIQSGPEVLVKRFRVGH